MIASGPDLLRLLALPAFAWAAWTDHQVRRTDSRVWAFIYGLGGVAAMWQVARTAPLQSVQALESISRLTLVPGVIGLISAFLYRIDAIGAADAKAFFSLGMLFPASHSYAIPSLGVELPLIEASSGVFASTVIGNSFLFGGFYLAKIWKHNYDAGDRSLMMLVSVVRSVPELEDAVGMIQCKPDGKNQVMVDADVLRMYLRWRDITFEEFAAVGSDLRDQDTIQEVYTVNDGAIEPPDNRIEFLPLPRGHPVDQSAMEEQVDISGDKWGVETFLDSIDHHAYGTEPDNLRAGLDYLAEAQTVRVQPAFPLLVPFFAGLVLSLTVGEVAPLVP
jgi:preflagellin peptidase FlaK